MHRIQKEALKLHRKLKESAGETLIETLAALLIACLGLLLLPGAIAASARVNAQAEKRFIYSAEDNSANQGFSPVDCAISISTGEQTVVLKDAMQIHRESKNGNVFYSYTWKNAVDEND